jgi:hypothetical protein
MDERLVGAKKNKTQQPLINIIIFHLIIRKNKSLENKQNKLLLIAQKTK